MVGPGRDPDGYLPALHGPAPMTTVIVAAVAAGIGLLMGWVITLGVAAIRNDKPPAPTDQGRAVSDERG